MDAHKHADAAPDARDDRAVHCHARRFDSLYYAAHPAAEPQQPAPGRGCYSLRGRGREGYQASRGHAAKQGAEQGPADSKEERGQCQKAIYAWFSSSGINPCFFFPRQGEHGGHEDNHAPAHRVGGARVGLTCSFFVSNGGRDLAARRPVVAGAGRGGGPRTGTDPKVVGARRLFVPLLLNLLRWVLQEVVLLLRRTARPVAPPKKKQG